MSKACRLRSGWHYHILKLLLEKSVNKHIMRFRWRTKIIC